MSGKVCQYCGYLKPANDAFCTTCTDEYIKIRSYIEERPASSLMEIAASTRIPLKKVRLFVEKGHFLLKE